MLNCRSVQAKNRYPFSPITETAKNISKYLILFLREKKTPIVFVTVLFVIFLFVFFKLFSAWVTCMNLCLGFPEFFAINIHSAVWLMKELPRTGDWPWGCRGSHRVHLNSLFFLLLFCFPTSEFLSITYRHQAQSVTCLSLWGVKNLVTRCWGFMGWLGLSS